MKDSYGLDSAEKAVLLGGKAHLFRYLDSVGDGTGTKNMAAAADEYFLKPPTTSTFIIDEINIRIDDDLIATPDKFGGITALGTGCSLDIMSQLPGKSLTQIVDLLDAVKLKTNADIAALGPMEIWNDAPGSVLVARINLRNRSEPVAIFGKDSEFLRFNVVDNLSTLLHVYVLAIGRITSNP